MNSNITELCEIAYKYGTDKCPQINHDYTPVYYNLLQPKRSSFKKILELGIGHSSNMDYLVPQYKTGASLYMWREFFPLAQIYGADYLPETMFKDTRIQTFLCNERKAQDLENLIGNIGSDIDLVIDDCSHRMKDQFFAAKTLLPLLKKDVIYIIEDVKNAKELGNMIKDFGNYDYEIPEFNPERNVRYNRLLMIKNI